MKSLFNVGWAFLSVLFFPTFVSDSTVDFSNSYFSILLFVAIFCLMQYGDKIVCDRRMRICTHILGLFFSLMTACGYSLDRTGTVWFAKIALSVVLFTHVFGVLLSVFWNRLMDLESKMRRIPSAVPFKHLYRGVSWMLAHPISIFLLLILCWMPCYIADFPGGFRYDATNEYNQIVNGFNGNFPLLHSALITRVLSLAYELTGSYNVGVVFLTVVQMLLVSAMYTQMLSQINKQGANKILIGIVLLYCGLFPVIHILVTQVVRDVLFSALLTYTVFLFYWMTSEREKFMKSRIKPAVLGFVFVITLLARNNNAGVIMMSMVIVVCVLVCWFNRKEYLRGACIFTITSIGSYCILSMILVMLCQPLVPAQTGASLSIMSQPLARAYIMEPEKWTEEEKEELNTYMDLTELKYVANNADPTKSRLKIDGNFKDFFVFWCKIGKKHFGCYIDAILANTQDMWFPSSVVDGYQNAGIEVYLSYDKCYYYIKNDIAEPAIHENLFPKLLKFYTKIGMYLSFEKIPIISMLFSIGFGFWILLHTLFYAIYRKRDYLYLPLSIILGYMLISAFVPLVLLRYFAALFFVMPMIILFTFQPSISIESRDKI